MAALHDLNYLNGGELTITVRVTRRFRFRFMAGLWLMRLGALILPMDTHVRTKSEDD